MQFRANGSVVLAAILLAGCASPNQRNGTYSSAWQDPDSVVSPSPVFPIAGPVQSISSGIEKPAPSTNTVINAPINVPMETWVPLQRWSRASNQAVLLRLASSATPTYSLQSTNGVLVLRAGSLLAHWEGIEVRLGFAPQLIDGQPFVHALDLKKTIQPLLQGETVPMPSQNPVVVIDPGHGGENAGTKSVLGNRYEKEFTLDWALRLQAVLMSNNCRAFLTRSNDSDLALSNRVAFASLHKADVFVSLHFNSAAPNEAEAGLETYCLTPAGMPSSLTRGFPDEIQQTFPNNGFDVQNLFLALRVHRALLQVNGHHDRGVRRARFPGVLRGQQRASILVEGGYLSNPQEARLIGEPGYRQRLAEAVATALLQKPAASSAVVALNASAAQLDPKPGPALANETAAHHRPSGDSSQATASRVLTEGVKVQSTDLPQNQLQQP